MSITTTMLPVLRGRPRPVLAEFYTEDVTRTLKCRHDAIKDKSPWSRDVSVTSLDDGSPVMTSFCRHADEPVTRSEDVCVTSPQPPDRRLARGLRNGHDEPWMTSPGRHRVVRGCRHGGRPVTSCSCCARSTGTAWRTSWCTMFKLRAINEDSIFGPTCLRIASQM